uniref:Uncharacterized protein n=1 Tax=Lotharella oceanica TaxID=641309 RepID=A0A7S2TZY9_9EUKA|mmetsp:Transcript_37469/g.69043  ORF Transcript_37469/g.69043 Transcript_37469/m.69043 type:complete len:317 (+) Transcript_37469:39-989(+)
MRALSDDMSDMKLSLTENEPSCDPVSHQNQYSALNDAGSETKTQTFSAAFRKEASLNCARVVSVLNALQLVGLINSLTGEKDESSVPAYFAAYALTRWISRMTLRRLRKQPRLLWVAAMALGHCLGFAAKDLFTSIVKLAGADENDGMLWVIVVTAVVASIFLPLLLSWKEEHCGCSLFRRTENDDTRARRRWIAAMEEVEQDGFAVCIAFLFYAALLGIMVSGDTLKEMFVEESECLIDPNQTIRHQTKTLARNMARIGEGARAAATVSSPQCFCCGFFFSSRPFYTIMSYACNNARRPGQRRKTLRTNVILGAC